MAEGTQEPAVIAVVVKDSFGYIEETGDPPVWASWEEVRAVSRACRLQLIAQGADYATLVNTNTAASKRFSIEDGNYRWDGPNEQGYIPMLEMTELGFTATWDKTGTVRLKEG